MENLLCAFFCSYARDFPFQTGEVETTIHLNISIARLTPNDYRLNELLNTNRLI